MNYTDHEYLKLFKQIEDETSQKIEVKDYSFEQIRGNSIDSNSYQRINEKPDWNTQLLNETPVYANYDTFKNLNEVQRSNYSNDFNINEISINTVINGENINEIRQIRQEEKQNRLNEVMQQMREARLNEIKENKENINEKIKFHEVEYVTLEMFEKARYNSMMQVAKIL